MNAGRILRSAGLDTPELRAELAPVDPDRINVYPASSLYRRLWRSGIKGVTAMGIVFVDPEVMRGDCARLGRLVVHELVHVRQFRQNGYLRFPVRYVYDYLVGRLRGLSGRDAYLQNPAEVEAREVTRRLIP